MGLFNVFKKSEFPKTLKRIWLSHECQFKTDNYFQSKELTRLSIGDRVPVLKSKDGKSFGIYEVVECHPLQGSDFAMWDDGTEYDLKLFKIASQPECYKLQPKMGFNFIR